MRIYQLRVYTLATREGLDFYKDVVYPRHLDGYFPKAGVTAHGFWTVPGDLQHRLFVLVSLDEGTDTAEVESTFMQDPDFLNDVRGMDPSMILGVEATDLTPTASSPLQ